jgi:hypothetical protein
MFALEDFDAHECDIPLKEIKTIPVIDYLDVSCRNKRMINGKGIDGILYTFEVVPRKPIPIVMTSDEFSQQKKSDEDYTEPKLI